MKHTDILTQAFVDTLAVGEYFTYKASRVFESGSFYRKGLKVSEQYMIPVGEHHDYF